MQVNNIYGYNYAINNSSKINTQPSFGNLVLNTKPNAVRKFLRAKKYPSAYNSFNEHLQSISKEKINFEGLFNFKGFYEFIKEDLNYIKPEEIEKCYNEIRTKMLEIMGEKESKDYTLEMLCGPDYYFPMWTDVPYVYNTYKGLRITKPEDVKSVDDIQMTKQEFRDISEFMQHKFFARPDTSGGLRLPNSFNDLLTNLQRSLDVDMAKIIKNILEPENNTRQKAGAKRYCPPRPQGGNGPDPVLL